MIFGLAIYQGVPVPQHEEAPNFGLSVTHAGAVSFAGRSPVGLEGENGNK
jgi:hypothetical protein